jgi:hypothetical protein
MSEGIGSGFPARIDHSAFGRKVHRPVVIYVLMETIFSPEIKGKTL